MGTGVGEAALIGAALGGGSAALTGGDPLKGALVGGLTGGVGSGIGGALAGSAGGAGAGAAGGAGASALGAGAAESGIMALAPEAATAAYTAPSYALSAPTASGVGLAAPAYTAPSYALSAPTASGVGFTASPAATAAGGAGTSGSLGFAQGSVPSSALGAGAPARASVFTDPSKFFDQNKYSLGAAGLAGALGARKALNVPGQEEYKGPLSRFRFDPDTYQAADYSQYRSPGYYAAGGIASLNTPAVRAVPGPSMNPKPQNFAAGGISQLGSYSDGGRMLKGPGDGMSDSIPASIAGKRPARLADGEFVVPADVVSGLGNGSTDAGAKQLYAMMDRVRQKRTGTTKQGRQIKPQKQMPV